MILRGWSFGIAPLIVALLMLRSTEAIRNAKNNSLKKDPSSLFQAWAMAPYQYSAPVPAYYYGYPYDPTQGQVMSGPIPPNGAMQAQQAVPLQAPPQMMYQPMMYTPPNMGEAPSLMPYYGGTPIMVPYNQMGYPVMPPASAVAKPVQQPSYLPEVHTSPAATSQEPTYRAPSVTVAAVESEPPVSPIQSALRKELDNASKQLDQIKQHATTNLAQFDDLVWNKPTTFNKPSSFKSTSKDPVPIDSHILNWRELVDSPH